jgi:hypothetical protein
MTDSKKVGAKLIYIPLEPARAVELLKCVDSSAGKAFKEMIFDMVAKTLEDRQ